ncbi:hypothetical protein [Streptomyces sp. AK02-04a]|uniref:hypothetical protein n=1 Tax=Streptomyces sp. AK02-04a TaxID=3028649 RepID=UPI0029A4C696|nr:hypothetical protein [Streptomyces sp. AK02-04a]MDX3762917.1 hypothetical protein [Streptomyces sp. AK02-04a]
MTSSSWDRSRHVTAATSILIVIAAAGMLVLALGTSTPEPWWPHTGHAFATDTHSGHQNPCNRIVGPAEEYCERGTTNSAPAGHHGAASAAWRLGTAGAGMAALVIWRRRSTTGQGRR